MKTQSEEKLGSGAGKAASGRTPEPRWPALAAMAAAGLVYLALPEPLSVGPGWLLLAVVVALEIPVAALVWSGKLLQAQRLLTLLANAAITLAMIASLVLLIVGIPTHRYEPIVLLKSASALWVTNVLVFAVWYWKLDAGGPTERERRRGRVESAFLFPQFFDPRTERPSWSPHFIDYLFLAFNTSTAFSPTDTAVLSRWAKAGMMLQSLISLTLLAVVAARAVGIF